MKGIWMLAAAALLVVGSGCAKKVDTLEGAIMEDVTMSSTDGMKDSTTEAEMLDETLVGGDIAVAEEPVYGSSVGHTASNGVAVAARIGDIHFDFDRALIRDRDKPVLLANAQIMKENPQLKFSVEGHCDARGTTAYNLALGEQRATATRRYLIALGVSPAQVTAVSYGEERPVCSQENERCWSQNRRSHTSLAR